MLWFGRKSVLQDVREVGERLRMFRAVVVLTMMSVLFLVAGCGDVKDSELPRSPSMAEVREKARVAGYEYQDAEQNAEPGEIDPGLSNHRKTFGVTTRVYSKAEAVTSIEALGGRYRQYNQKLHLSGTQITDGGLVHLKGLTSLRQLNLSDTQITDAGLEHVKGFVKLESLSLVGTQITDVGLKSLVDLSRLSTLNLAETQITDVGLKHLRKLTNLRQLLLSGTPTTPAAREELRAALPEWVYE